MKESFFVLFLRLYLEQGALKMLIERCIFYMCFLTITRIEYLSKYNVDF